MDTRNDEEPSIDVAAMPAAGTGLTRRAFVRGLFVVAGGAGLGMTAFHLPGAAAQAAAGDAEKPTLYLIATAHNDTQWNWTVQHTIAHCIPNTMRPNWELFKKYPAYNFNYEGVIHYMWFKEYHPEDWPELQDWVRKGRWKLSGSWINAVDVITPSPESLFRQALYGQQFFRREFGQVSRDIYLPDCFGFPYSLPTIGRHSGLQSFSTQKFQNWGGWCPTPFAVGRWEGPDGSQLVSALRPNDYGHKIRSDAARDPFWINDMADAGGKKVDLRYFGTGDQGGTPGDESCSWLQKSVDDTDAPVRVVNTSADQLAKDLTPAQIAALPLFKNELALKTHGVGGYTSQAAHKKWNRLNEQMADAAERAAVAAAWLGGPEYPTDTLRAAWIRTLWHQFHDELPGTCVPKAYTFVWNDDLLNLNQLSQVMTAGVGAMAQHLDTQAQGVPLVVYNPLDQPRTDAVEADVLLTGDAPAVRVFDAVTGAEVPSQTLSRDGARAKIVFIAHAPSVGCRVYDVRPSPTPCALPTGLHATPHGLESARYRVTVNASGDIAGVYDKAAKTELLSAPTRLDALQDISLNYPAWELQYAAVQGPPLGEVHENAAVVVTEHGPARVALQVTRTWGESTFVQHIRLTPDGDWVEVHNDLDWQSPVTLIKAAFPMTASNPTATFDMGLGTIERPNADPQRYEVNGQQWADITDAHGGHGLAILTSTKYGWDKPDDNTLRLTLIRTPGGHGSRYVWQRTNDIGHHHIDYGLAGHAGDWRAGSVVQSGARFNQPLRAFQTTPHAGVGGREFSLLGVSTNQVGVRALKQAEDSPEWVVRLWELHGQPAPGAVVSFPAPVVSVREINAAEEAVGPYSVQDGKLAVDLTAYQPRSFAVTLAAAPQKIAATVSTPVALPYDLAGVSSRADLAGVSSRADLKGGAFDPAGGSYPAELWPETVDANGIVFHLGHGAPGVKNMVSCQGQTIALPAGDHDRLYLLAASVGGDRHGEFAVHSAAGAAHETSLTVQDWQALIGQWYSRVIHNDPADVTNFGPGTGYPKPDWDPNLVLADMSVKTIRNGRVVDIGKITPGFVKRDPVAWVGTHRHTPDGDLPYCFCYLFKYMIDLPAGATGITLPNDPNIRVMAMTAARNTLDDTKPAGLLYEPDPFPPVVERTPMPVSHLVPGSIVFRQPAGPGMDAATNASVLQVDVPDLPVEASAPWTINQFVSPTVTPTGAAVLGGFGDGAALQGQQRYLINLGDGIGFWDGQRKVNTGTPFDAGRWQMVTLTFDGKTLTIYKNGQALKSVPLTLDEADNEVKIGVGRKPRDWFPFAGKVAGFTIWNSALDAAAVQALLADMPHTL